MTSCGGRDAGGGGPVPQARTAIGAPPVVTAWGRYGRGQRIKGVLVLPDPDRSLVVCRTPTPTQRHRVCRHAGTRCWSDRRRRSVLVPGAADLDKVGHLYCRARTQEAVRDIWVPAISATTPAAGVSRVPGEVPGARQGVARRKAASRYRRTGGRGTGSRSSRTRTSARRGDRRRAHPYEGRHSTSSRWAIHRRSAG